jgi:hypothetical protein
MEKGLVEKAGWYGEHARKGIALVRRYASLGGKEGFAEGGDTVERAEYEAWQDARRAARYGLEVIGREEGEV